MAKENLRDWFNKNSGTGWVDCKTGGPCGRKKGEKRGYPACRPTLAECKEDGAPSAIKQKKSSKPVSWKSKGGEMVKQNRIKKKNGGFIAKGCGKVMNNRRKVTTISLENRMFKKTKGYSSGGKIKSKGMKNGGLIKSKGMKNGGQMKSKGMKKGGVMKSKGYKKGGKVGKA